MFSNVYFNNGGNDATIPHSTASLSRPKFGLKGSLMKSHLHEAKDAERKNFDNASRTIGTMEKDFYDTGHLSKYDILNDCHTRKRATRDIFLTS